MKRVGILLMVMLLAAAALFAGCGSDDGGQQNQNQQPQQQEQQSQQEQEPEAAPNSDAQNVQAQVEQVTLTGQFNGLADSHSVEVTVDGEPTVFQFSGEEMLQQLEIMEQGTEIKFDAEFETDSNVRRMVKLYEEAE